MARFEKWQALGNDYVIVERDALGFELSPAAVQLLCDQHLGIGADGILELAPDDEAGYVAALRIFNPDGSEAELSGNGAREAILYLVRSGWTDQKQFSVRTVAGEIRPTIIDERTCAIDIGRARLKSADFPSGDKSGTGELEAGGQQFVFQHVQVGNPQCSIHVADVRELESLDLELVGPEIEHHALFPHRTNVSFFCELADGSIRARIFERGVGETSASGTGACGAAVTSVLRGGDAPVVVQLDGGELTVDVDEALGMTLTGWAEPVYRGELSDELIAALRLAQ